MRGKRLLAAILSVFLMVNAIPATAQAGVLDDIKEMPNAYAAVEVENYDCENLNALIEAEDLKVVVDAETLEEPITIPVEAVKEDGEFMYLWFGTGTERLEDELMKQLAELQGEVDLELEEGFDDETGDFSNFSLVEPRNEKASFTVRDAKEIISNVKATFGSFTVTLEGESAEHYEETAGVVIITADIVRQVVEYLDEVLEEIFEKEFNSFSEVIAELDTMLQEELEMTLDEMLVEMELPEEDLAKVRDLIENIDAIVDYFQSEEFTGILMSTIVLKCDCPVKEYYWITHHYYERTKDGLTFVGETYEDTGADWALIGNAGDIVYGNGFVNEEYEGKTYEYAGSYSEDYYWEVDVEAVRKLEEIEQYKMDSIVLGEDYSELILVYVRDVETSETVDMGDSDDEVDGDDIVLAGTGEAAPPTGDMNNSSIYLISGLASVVAIVACVYYRKKRSI